MTWWEIVLIALGGMFVLSVVMFVFWTLLATLAWRSIEGMFGVAMKIMDGMERVIDK